MNLPFNLPSEPIPDDPKNAISSPFSLENIPPDAPQPVKNLMINMSELLTALAARKGEDYTNKTLFFIVAYSNLFQLEEIACNATNHIINQERDERNINYAQTQHATAHLLASSSSLNLATMLLAFNESEGYKGIRDDVHMLLSRINTDYISKL